MKSVYKLIGFITVAVIVFSMTACPMYDDIDTRGVPKFVSVNYIDLHQRDAYGNFLIGTISRFRSSEGHDYSDDFEKNRSMKHYFYSPGPGTMIYSPVNGTITRIERENYENSGFQIHIASNDYPAFTFIIFHFDPVKDFVFGEKVAKGKVLGSHSKNSNVYASDIAVVVKTSKGRRLVSYFETLTPEALKPFTDRLPDFMDKIIITKAERDANPLYLAGKDAFANADSDPLAKCVLLPNLP